MVENMVVHSHCHFTFGPWSFILYQEKDSPIETKDGTADQKTEPDN